MKSSWIKMRGALFNSPKLIVMSRLLHDDKNFREWLTPGGSGAMNEQIVSDHALRCVTGSLLCVTWSWSREFGKQQENDDCLLERIEISDIDGIAGAPGIGDAMAEVGWALQVEQGVLLPNFFADYNAPMTDAEKQKEYRKRKKALPETLPSESNEMMNSSPLLSSRSSFSNSIKEGGVGEDLRFPAAIDTPEARTAWCEWLEHRRRIKKPYRAIKSQQMKLNELASLGAERFVNAIHHSIGSEYQGIFEPKATGRAVQVPYAKPTTYEMNKQKLMEIAQRERDEAAKEA